MLWDPIRIIAQSEVVVVVVVVSVDGDLIGRGILKRRYYYQIYHLIGRDKFFLFKCYPLIGYFSRRSIHFFVNGNV